MGVVAWLKFLMSFLDKGGNPENNSHPEFISGSLKLDAETSSA